MERTSERELVVNVYRLEHQPASEAWALLQPLLSARGTVELQPGGNTIVVRDIQAALDRIVPELRGFDHAPRPMRLRVQIVQAFQGTAAAAPLGTTGRLSPELVRRLRELLRYDSYVLNACVIVPNVSVFRLISRSKNPSFSSLGPARWM